MDPDEFRRLAHVSVDLVADYLAGLPDTPVFRPMSPRQRRHLTDQVLSEHGVAPASLIEDFAENILPYAMGNGHQRFFGWVNSPPAPIGIIAELLAAAQGPSCDVGDIASLYLESAAVRWLAELVGYPSEAMGILVSGGSMATLTGLAAARQWLAETDGWDVRADGVGGAPDGRPVVYASDEAHSSVRKAVELLGLGSRSIRQVPTDERHRLDPVRLAQMVAADRTAGMRPFCVVATAGTTSTGAVDPFESVADVCARHGLWLHVDGAYGALGGLHPDLRDAYAGLSRADSLTVDPHKWLSVPVECGCVLVRDKELLRRTFSLVPPYLFVEVGKGIGGPPSYAEYGFQQTRGFRALKLWMTLAHAGRGGVTDLVVRHVGLARQMAELVDAAPDLELAVPVQLAVVCFRYVGVGSRDDADLDALNRAVEVLVQSDGRAFLTSTVVNGRFVLRASVLHHGTTLDDIRVLLDAVREFGARVQEQGIGSVEVPASAFH
ncbi:pyridoxal phosphate-dependent decarboxylase family protein [Micromonospora sp. NPDC051141]|uniref:pyridoxal phosphate-dependent decarboxylase family protein n=1 Tax=Micromonospora sp. NPDC051141 TaxID=3364284 RepID=UPI0037AD2502